MSNLVSFVMLGTVMTLAMLMRWGKRQAALLDTTGAEAKREAFWCLFPGLLLVLLGGNIAFTWPLSSTALAAGTFSGNANIVIGWPAFFFGLLLILAWVMVLLVPGPLRVIWQPLCSIASFGGIMLLVLGVAILAGHIGQPPSTDPMLIQQIANPLIWAILYWLMGLAACISPLALTRPRWMVIGKGLLLLPLLVLSLFTLFTLIVHVQIPHLLS